MESPALCVGSWLCLSNLCQRSIATDIVQGYKTLLATVNDDDWDCIIDFLRMKLLKFRDVLPEDIFRNILAQISLFSPEITILASLVCGINIEQRDSAPVLPDAVLLRRFSSLEYDIQELIFDDISITDAMMEALAGSKAAGSLRKLSFRVGMMTGGIGRITDCSSHVWTKFSRLETLETRGNVSMGLESLRQIASCQSLISLKVSKPLDEPKETCDDCISVLLGGASLPNLSNITVDLSEIETIVALATIQRVLKTREAPLERLKKLRFCLDSDGENNLALAIHEQCPNLQSPILRFHTYTFEETIFRGPFRSLTSILSLSIAAEHLSALADLSPGLRKLGFVEVSGVLNLAVFERFQDLHLLWIEDVHCLEVPKLVALPDKLTVLEIDAHGSLLEPEKDHLIDSICSNNTNLRSLILRQRASFFSLRHLDKLLRSLQKLERLTIDSDLPYLGMKDIIHELSHPTLRQRPVVKLDENVNFKFGFLPSHRRIRINDLKSGTGERVDLSAFPTATHLEYQAAPDDAAEILQLLKSPKAWHITEFASTTAFPNPLDQLSLLPTLSKLERVILPFQRLPQSLAESLFRDLPLLSYVNASFVARDNSGDLSWIKHKRLADLVVGIQPENASTKLDGISFLGHDLPSLRSLNVNYQQISSLASVELCGFNKVHILSLHGRKGTEPAWIKLQLSDFPSIGTMYITGVSLYSLSISGVPLLSELKLDPCDEHEDISVGAFEVPKRARVSGLRAAVEAHKK